MSSKYLNRIKIAGALEELTDKRINEIARNTARKTARRCYPNKLDRWDRMRYEHRVYQFILSEVKEMKLGSSHVRQDISGWPNKEYLN